MEKNQKQKFTLIKILFALFFLSPISLLAEDSASGKASSANKQKTKQKMVMGPEDCSEMMVWERTTLSCIPLPMDEMPMGMWMVHGNGFLVQNSAESVRGRSRLTAPHMLMTDVGHSYGNHYLNADFMLTLERWTFPKDGNPLLLQIGEVNQDNQPYIDAQHPHSSPIMGLTLSDTIRLGEGKDYLKIFFAPRGQATDGPIPYMHRPTGMINPDAPLGHHTAQDVSHITSTVIGSLLAFGKFQIEGSVFNGAEPEPAKVDLPIGNINSFAARLGYQFSDSMFAMISGAQFDPSDKQMTMPKAQRYSGSIYTRHKFSENWMLHNTLIYGQLNNHENIPVLKSYGEEFLFHKNESSQNIWGRIEFVERTAMQLAIATMSGADDPKIVTAVTAGYTYTINPEADVTTGIGGSVTKNFLPTEFKDAYAGNPLSGKIFIQLSGMKMGDLLNNTSNKRKAN